MKLKCDVLVNRQGIKERALLKDHADLFPHAHHLALPIIGDIFTVDENLAVVRLDQAKYQLDGG